MEVSKTNVYKLLENFRVNTIDPMEKSANSAEGDKKDRMKKKVAEFDKLYKAMLSLLYSHVVFVTESRNFHEGLVNSGAVVDWGVNPDQIDKINEAYKKHIGKMYEHYKKYDFGLIPDDKVVKVMTDFAEKFGRLEVFNNEKY